MDKLAYYKTKSYITDPKNYSEYFNNLSNSVEDVVKIVQGIIVDKDLIGLYGETISENQKEDMDTRYVSDIMLIIISILHLACTMTIGFVSIGMRLKRDGHA